MCPQLAELTPGLWFYGHVLQAEGVNEGTTAPVDTDRHDRLAQTECEQSSMQAEADDAARVAIASDQFVDLLGVELRDAIGDPLRCKLQVGLFVQRGDDGDIHSLKPTQVVHGLLHEQP